MDGDEALVAHAESAEPVEPCLRALDHPMMPAQPLTRLDTDPGYPGHDVIAQQVFATVPPIIRLVTMQLLRPAPWGRPHGRWMGGTASSACSNAFESVTLAGVRTWASGTPWASTTRWRFVPGLPRSVGDGPVVWPPFLPAPW